MVKVRLAVGVKFMEEPTPVAVVFTDEIPANRELVRLFEGLGPKGSKVEPPAGCMNVNSPKLLKQQSKTSVNIVL
jgi:hypothetical protein